MACFITPLLVGIAVKLFTRIWKNSSKFRLDILEIMLISGSLVLALEHVWHGEVVPYPPFLTAMQNPDNIPVVLREISIVGSSMTIIVFATWFSIITFTGKISLKQPISRFLRIRIG